MYRAQDLPRPEPVAQPRPTPVYIRPVNIRNIHIEPRQNTEPLPAVQPPVVNVTLEQPRRKPPTPPLAAPPVIHVRVVQPPAPVERSDNAATVEEIGSGSGPATEQAAEEQPSSIIEIPGAPILSGWAGIIKATLTRPEKSNEKSNDEPQKNQTENQRKIKESFDFSEPENQNEIDEKIKEPLTEPEPKNQSENQRKIKEPLIFKAPEPAQGAEPEKPTFYKKVGRQRTEEKTKDVIVFRLSRGVWPVGLSPYMCWYYNQHYIQQGGKFYANKTKLWKSEIRAKNEAGAGAKTGKIDAARPQTRLLSIRRANH